MTEPSVARLFSWQELMLEQERLSCDPAPCRAQNLEPQCFQLTKGDGRLLLPEQDGGGMGAASVVWMGDRGLFQI